MQSWVIITAFLVASALWLWMFWFPTNRDTPPCPQFNCINNKRENMYASFATILAIVLRTAVYQGECVECVGCWSFKYVVLFEILGMLAKSTCVINRNEVKIRSRIWGLLGDVEATQRGLHTLVVQSMSGFVKPGQ